MLYTPIDRATFLGHYLPFADTLDSDLVLVAEDGTSWRFLFIDLDDVRVQPEGARPPTRADWVRALSQLESTTPEAIPWTDRLRFVERLACKAFPRRELLTEVLEASRRLGRNYFSDDGPVERKL